VAQYLIAHEKIDGPDFEKLMKGELTEPEQPAQDTAPVEEAAETVESAEIAEDAQPTEE
jgi:hypothetical protein